MSAKKPLSLMIVDDSMVFRNRIARLVGDGELSHITVVARAENGSQALDYAKRYAPELITMDLTMPIVDGPTCLTELKKLLPDSRIIVVSALSDRSTALKAMSKGAHGFLLKPFSDEQLIESIVELAA
jgi:two-component system, chemotaxis family, chemotaxis protein CheY